jgi:hypothetical protein
MNTTLFQMIRSEGMRVDLRICLSSPKTSAIRHSSTGSGEGSSPLHARVLRSKSTIKEKSERVDPPSSPAGRIAPHDLFRSEVLMLLERRVRQVWCGQKEFVTLSKRAKGKRGCLTASLRKGSSDVEYREEHVV